MLSRLRSRSSSDSHFSEKIAKLENIEVTEDELKAEFDKLAEGLQA